MAAKKSNSGNKKSTGKGTKKAGKRVKATAPGQTAKASAKKKASPSARAGKLAARTVSKTDATKPKGASAPSGPRTSTRANTGKEAASKIVSAAKRTGKTSEKGSRSSEPRAQLETSAAKLVNEVNSPETNAVATLSVGDHVPEFEAIDQAGQKVSNRDWGGAPYVIYFYPKDDTPGCTTEACGFRDELSSFNDLGVKVVGCSPDSPSAHTRFATKYGLQFTLIADIEKDLVQLFGVWKLKQNYGREYMGVERSTFLIDKNGNVARQWRGVRVAGHVSEVLAAVREL